MLSNMIKQKRKEKAGKWQVPIPKVKAMTEDEMFKILRTGTFVSDQVGAVSVGQSSCRLA